MKNVQQQLSVFTINFKRTALEVHLPDHIGEIKFQSTNTYYSYLLMNSREEFLLYIYQICKGLELEIL